jgi:hypothetical protein
LGSNIIRKLRKIIAVIKNKRSLKFKARGDEKEKTED